MTIRAFRDMAGRAHTRAGRLSLAYPLIRIVDPPAALPFAGTVVVVVVAVGLEDDLFGSDCCRLVRIEHPARVRKALRGLRDDFVVRGFVVRVWEDVETEGDKPSTRWAPSCLTARCGRSW